MRVGISMLQCNLSSNIIDKEKLSDISFTLNVL